MMIDDVRQMNNLRAFMSSENPEVDPTRTADKARDKFVIVQLIINGHCCYIFAEIDLSIVGAGACDK